VTVFAGFFFGVFFFGFGFATGGVFTIAGAFFINFRKSSAG
jgi:hypothetical protein